IYLFRHSLGFSPFRVVFFTLTDAPPQSLKNPFETSVGIEFISPLFSPSLSFSPSPSLSLSLSPCLSLSISHSLSLSLSPSLCPPPPFSSFFFIRAVLFFFPLSPSLSLSLSLSL